MTKKFQYQDHLIFACAGCSHAGQTAYRLALSADKKGLMEMSCLAGVAAEKPSFLKKVAKKKVVAIDGCPIECAKGIFDKLGIAVHQHVQLKDFGINKNHPQETDNDLEDRIENIYI